MRRKRRKKSISIMEILFLVTIFTSVVSFGYSYLSLVLKIGGSITGKVVEQSYTLASGSDPSLNLKVYQMSKQYQNNIYQYRYSLSLKNTGSSTINGIRITLDTNSVVGSVIISGYDYKITGKSITITSSNKNLIAGETITIDLIIESSNANLQIISVKLEKFSSVGVNDLNIAFNIISSTDSYIYTYNVTITNSTSTRTSSWRIDITLPIGTSYVSGSGAIFTTSNNVLTIKNGKDNAKITAGYSITIGLQLSTNIVNYIPNNIITTVG
jgi:hypothetical protein